MTRPAERGPLGDPVRAGSTVTCPECRAEIATTTRDIWSGHVLTESQFDFRPGFAVQSGDRCICRECRTPWYYSGCLHTSEGWYPSEPWGWRVHGDV